MRTRYALLGLLLGLTVGVVAQGGLHIPTFSTLPTSCQVGDIAYKTGSGAGLYSASSTGPCVWAAATTGGVTTTGSPMSGEMAKFSGSASITTAVSGTDYAPATSGTDILYGNGAGGFSSVTVGSGLDFTTGTLSATGSGVTRSFGITIDGAGSTITTGVKGFIQAPVSGTIASWTLLSTDASATAGSIVVEIDKDVYANYPPNGSDKICASACPTLSSVNKNTSSSLGTWTTAVTAGDVFGFNVTSVSTVSRVTLVLTYQ
jgi:hypothetical protein